MEDSKNLTPFEEKINRLMEAGEDNEAIAEKLSISRHTVKSYKVEIERKIKKK